MGRERGISPQKRFEHPRTSDQTATPQRYTVIPSVPAPQTRAQTVSSFAGL
jgi:hypothetical protein